MRLDSAAEQKRGERETWDTHIRDVASKVSPLKLAAREGGHVRQQRDPVTRQWKPVRA